MPEAPRSVDASELQEGTVCFRLGYFDAEMSVPSVEPVVYIGRNLEPGDEAVVYFQDYESYGKGVRFGLGSGRCHFREFRRRRRHQHFSLRTGGRRITALRDPTSRRQTGQSRKRRLEADGVAANENQRTRPQALIASCDDTLAIFRYERSTALPREPSVRRMIADVGRISNVVSVGCFWAVFTCGVLGVGCTVEHRDSALPAAVIVVPGGLNKQVSDIYDGQVSYQVRDPYPGERTIGEIHRRLGAEGWRRRNYDFMNPTLTAEITAQWRTLETAAGDSIAWAEQWENAAGDVVAYGFKYSVPTGREPTAETSMEVLVSHFRAATVRKLEAEIR